MNMSGKTLHVYVLHARWLKDRQKNIQEIQNRLCAYSFQNFQKIKINVVEDFDPESIDSDIIRKTVNYSSTQNEFFNSAIKNLHIFQLSNTLKHHHALKMIAECENSNDFHLVIEDDVLYQDKVCLQLDRIVTELKKDETSMGIVFLGLPSTLKTDDNVPQFQPYDDVFRVLPYCDSYFIDSVTAKTLVDMFMPVKFISNIQMSFALTSSKCRSRIACPNVFMDGSKAGMFLSTLTPNNQLIFHSDYVRAKQTLDALNDQKLSKKEACNELDNIFKTTNIREHPDMLHLKGLYIWLVKGDAKDSQNIFDKALNIYKANSCILGQESQLLKDYMKTFRDTQQKVN